MSEQIPMTMRRPEYGAAEDDRDQWKTKAKVKIANVARIK